MKKIIFITLFLSILFGAYGQTIQENSWIFGNWIVNDEEQIVVFNNDGSGILDGEEEFYYSITQTTIGVVLTLFFKENFTQRFSLNRINNQRIIIIDQEYPDDIITLIKTN